MSFWKELFDFYYYGSYSQFKELSRSSIFGAIFVTLLFTMLFNMIIEVPKADTPLQDLYNNGQSNLWVRGLIIILVAPVIEEFAFRFFLGSFDTTKFLISFSLIISYFLFFFLHLILGNEELNHVYSYVLLVGFSLCLFFIFYFLKDFFTRIRYFWNRNAVKTIYISSISFSLIHITWPVFQSGFFDQVIYLVPIFIFSLVASFIRIRLGFLYSIFFHVSLNAPALLKIIIVNYYQNKYGI